MNTQEIIDYVKNSFGDTSGVQIDDTDIIRWINAAQHNIVMQNEAVLEEETTVDLVKGKQDYDFPSDLLILRSLRVQVPDKTAYTRIKPYSLQAFDRKVYAWDGSERHTGQPVIYTTYAKKIYLYPTPNESRTDGLKILYSKEPTKIETTAGELSLPILYHNAIVEYCLAQAHSKDEDYEAATVHRAQYTEDVRMLSYKEQMEPREYYPKITAMPEDI